MNTLELKVLDGAPAVIDEPTLEAFEGRFRGQIITAAHPDYEVSRKVWNGLIDRKPGMIARCSGVADVIAALGFARENRVLIAVRGGGHSFPGHSVCDGGIVIDLSRMKGVRLNAEGRTALAQAGVTWGELDHETQAFGLATPGGVVSETGIAGLTLGGGSQSWLARKYGTTADNLISVDVVTADGRYLKANAEENPDLFWAVRGGGGNFGIVTAFEYQLHPVGPIVFAGSAFFGFDRAKEIMEFYLNFVSGLPDELTTSLNFWTAPPAPFLPPHTHGRLFAIISVCYAGSVEDGESAVAQIRAMRPEVDLLGPVPYVALQSIADAFFPRGILVYGKSDYYDEITTAAIDEIVRHVPRMPSTKSFVHLNHYGGALRQVAPDATPFAHRNAEFAFSIDAAWDDSDGSDANIHWVQQFWQAMRQHSPRGSYVNFLGDEGQDRVRETYGTNYGRLAAIKAKYDPGNLFRLNQNIRPEP